MSMPDASRMTTLHTHRSYSIHLNLRFGFGLLVSSTTLVLLMTNTDQILSLDLKTACAMLSVISILVASITIALTPGNIWAPSSVYLVMLTLFHFGLVLIYAFGSISETMRNIVERWFFGVHVPEALLVTAIGVVACSLGISAVGLLRRPRDMTGTEDTALKHDTNFDHYLSLIGSCMVVSAVIAWFAFVVLSGGFSLLFGSYGTYLTATAGAPMGYIWILLGSGLAFLAATSTDQPSRAHVVAYAAFGAFALFGLPMGLRGEVLFASLGALVIRARRGRRSSWAATLVGVLIVLVMISAIREMRQVGVSEAGTIAVDASVWDGVAELGSTLRPVVETIKWDTGGTEGQNGATYWAPVDRLFCRVLPARNCANARDDPRLLNVVVADRVGPIGFSPIAEAYENFRITGVLTVMFLIGSFVGFMNGWPSTTISNAAAGVILVELLINVRNAFTALPTHLMFGFVCILAAVILAKLFPLTTPRPRESNYYPPASLMGSPK